MNRHLRSGHDGYNLNARMTVNSRQFKYQICRESDNELYRDVTHLEHDTYKTGRKCLIESHKVAIATSAFTDPMFWV